MFGFLFGALCLGGLAAMVFHRPHRFGGHCHHGHHGHGRGLRRFALHRALERLDTTPGQEKVIVAALDELTDAARHARSKVVASRGEVAAALRGEHFEAATVDAVLARHAEDVAGLGSAARSALAKIHEALDPEQRKRLAGWIEAGPGFRWA